LGNQKAISKEIGRLAVLKLKLFDRAFRSRINNASGCRIGGKQLVVDFNRLFECLREFMESTANVNDCPINDFLGFSSPHGRSQALLSHSGAASTKAGVKLLKLAEKKKHVDCGRCSRIGDAVIAMEQSKAFVLAHIDESFESLCEATGREHVPIKSARACASDGGPTSG
jgi:hypothetical protein